MWKGTLMRYEIKTIDEEKKITRITTVNERFYCKELEDGTKVFYPSSTWICDYYPKGVAYYKWLANHGWDEAEALKIAAGEKGSKVHQAIEELLMGKTLNMESQYLLDNGESEELTLEEYECLMSFVAWFQETKPKVICYEAAVFNNEYKYAGTLDMIFKFGNNTFLVDFKTSQYIWPSHKLQVSSYKHTDYVMKNHPEVKPAILQLGYRMNKRRYKFTEIDDCFDLFLSARKIWDFEVKDKQPLEREYPLELTLKKEE